MTMRLLCGRSRLRVAIVVKAVGMNLNSATTLALLVALSLGAVAQTSCRDSERGQGPINPYLVCDNTCKSPGDAECDDGGEGSDFDRCDLGTDCDDCGPRTIPPDAGLSASSAPQE